MLQASKLGPDVATRLPKPSLVPSTTTHLPSTGTGTATATAPPPQANKKTQSSRLAHEVTFKSIAEEFAAEHNLLWVPLGRVHEKSRLPMYRVTARADGKSGGVVVYVLDDALWFVEDGSSSGNVRAITLEEMALLGAKK
jgi:tuftelin-interacting protein 11